MEIVFVFPVFVLKCLHSHHQISMNVMVRLATACQKKMADNVQTQKDLTRVLVPLITMATEYLKAAHSETILEMVVNVSSDLMSATTVLVLDCWFVIQFCKKAFAKV